MLAVVRAKIASMAEKTVDDLIVEMSSGDGRARAAAVEHLYTMGAGAKAAVPFLAKALADPSFMVQLWAVKALGSIGPDSAPAVCALIGALRDPTLRTYAASTLGKIGPGARPALEALEESMVYGSDEAREASAMAVVKIDGTKPKAIEAIRGILKEGRDPVARMYAAADLGRIGDPADLPILVAMLRDPSRGVRREAAIAVGRFGDLARSSAEALRGLLGDADEGVRFFAAEALWSVAGDPSGLPHVVPMLDRSRPPSVDEETGYAFAASVEIRVRAAELLASMGTLARAALSSLSEAESDPAPEVVAAVRRAIEHVR
jgi:HEAT repeat protein